MNTEPFGPELTAFALNDPSLTDTQKQAVEARLAADPAARQFVDDTRSLVGLLTENLAMNMEPTNDSPMVQTVASTMQPTRKRGMLPWWATAMAACVAFALGVGYMEGKAKYAKRYEPHIAYGMRPASLGELDNNLGEKPTSVPEHASNSHKLQQQGASAPAWANTNGKLNGGFGGGAVDQFQDVSKNGSVRLNLHSGVVPTPRPQWYSIQPPPTNNLMVNPETGMIYDPNNRSDPNNPVNAMSRTLSLPIDPGATAHQLQMLNAEREVLMQSGLGKDHEKIRAINAQVNMLENQQRKNPSDDLQGRSAYPQLVENPFTEVKGQAALSTFGVDVDTASYSLIRNYLNHNQLPPKDAVRLEEMVNYFPYKDAPPEGNDPYVVRVEMAECPWQPKHKLARIALKAKPIDNSKRPKSNLVFLIDVSGSMDQPNKLPLVKAAMKLLVGQLGENDRVALVVYAGASGLVLDSTNCGNKDTILKALDDLKPGGSTNGASGIQLAYDIAVNNFIKDGTNRVILCTDGDWNVGTTSTDALIRLIEEKRKTGVFLSVFGFGMGNLRDEMMVQLAGKGNGNYAYIDTIAEAKKALVEQVSGTLVTVAKDVKIQIEFNPARVASYRLLGYEKRILAAKDFHDDKKDAGEMGAGHVVTALYELVPAGAVAEPKVDGLRYQPKVEAPKPVAEDKTAKEAFVLKLRHKMPDKDESVLREIPVPDEAKPKDKASDDFQFASAVAAFALLLKDSPYKAGANFGLVEELAGASLTNDPGAYRAEFLQLVKKARALAGK